MCDLNARWIDGIDGSRQLWRTSKLTTAGDGDGPPQLHIIHPFHPLRGAVVRYVVTGKLWGEARVTVETAEGTLRSLPVGWTDLLPVEPIVTAGRGRAAFRLTDLVTLADLVEERTRR